MAETIVLIDCSKRVAAKALVLILLLCTSAQAEQSRKLIITGDLPAATDADISFCDEALKRYSREYSKEIRALAIQPKAAALVYALGYPLSQEYVQSLDSFPLLNSYLSEIVEAGEVPGSTKILPGGFEGTQKAMLKCSPKSEQRKCLYLWSRSDVYAYSRLCDALHSTLKY
ncbi:hypothetical protein MWU76_18015 [Gelidibacter sp. F2691]|nr:hypothetical protein [Gelidibacter sp. F2691]